MGIKQYLRVSDLPASLRGALESVSYAKVDIAVEAQTEVSIRALGGDGYQAFAVIVNLETGQTGTHWGSWGGPNAFSSDTNPVDADGRMHAIPVNGAAITGRRGGGRSVLATIHVHPDNLAKLLPGDTSELSLRERYVLHVYDGIKSSYRAEYLRFIKGRDALVMSLVERGYLKRNSNGATQITTAGKNARGDGNADRYRWDLEKMESAS
ncbi:MAG TPA: hypothetical protein VGM94_00890 [Galbitalea sp.]|jgi:hypothetical protein